MADLTSSRFSFNLPPVCLDWSALRASPEPLETLGAFIQQRPEAELDHLLAQAASLGWTPAVALLLDAGASPNAVVSLDRPRGAVSHACAMGHLETCELLLARGASARGCEGQWEPCMSSAAIGLSIECVNALLRADPSARADLDAAFLCLCAYSWEPDLWSSAAAPMAEELIHLGARVDAQNIQKRSALHFCCARGDAGAHQTRSLLDWGAHPSLLDQQGMTPMAALFGRHDGGALTLQALLDAQADPSIADESGASPSGSPERFKWRAGQAILQANAERLALDSAVPCPLSPHKSPRI